MSKGPLRQKFFKLVKICLLVLGLFVVGTILFIKFNTGAAAELADNVLRPLLGNEVVISLEKLYFNFTDKVQSITYNPNSAGHFTFSDQSESNNAPVTIPTRLDINPIPVSHNFKPEKGEGVWKNRHLKIFPNQEVMAYTFVRPDPDRPFAYVTLMQIDTKEIHLSAVAGTKQPGGPVGNIGPGAVPSQIVLSGKLVAAFDGGFQYRDGQYGMIVDGHTYLPLKENVGTLVGYKDGTLKIIDYLNQSLGNNVEFVRQNCPILIENGEISILNEKNKQLWGRTLTSSIFTWRTGVGITKKGNLLFAVGNNLTPLSLSYALKMAGAVNAIQLDINPYWVRFNIFDNTSTGQYHTSTLTPDLKDGSTQYLHGYSKDFFYLYKN